MNFSDSLYLKCNKNKLPNAQLPGLSHVIQVVDAERLGVTR
jgi:hypothetical protein